MYLHIKKRCSQTHRYTPIRIACTYVVPIRLHFPGEILLDLTAVTILRISVKAQRIAVATTTKQNTLR